MSKLFCFNPGLRVLERQMQEPPGYRPRGYGICIIEEMDWKSRGNYSEIVDCVISRMQLEHLKKRVEEIFAEADKELIFRNMKHRNDFYSLLMGKRAKGLSLLTDFTDARQVGVRLYMDEFLAMSEEEKEQTNFIEFAEKTLKESRVEVLPYGVFVEHGFEMQEVYNGKTFPPFVASDEVVAVVEVQNKREDTEFFYLPMDICSMNKVKERLQVQDYWEMEVIEIENLRLPDILVPTTEDLREVERLTLFNEMCHAVKRFDEVKMNQLAMVVEFTGLCDFPDVAYIATHLGEFEINPLVHNDEEYGKFLVTESGLFDVDELLLPHINYASFAADKRVGTLETSGYVEGGFVGVTRPIEEYGKYMGEFADPLEIDYDCFEKFCLYSPLTGNLMVEGVDEGNLYRSDLTQYAEAMAEAIAKEENVGEETRGLMYYFDESREVAAKVMSAYPKVAEINGELYGVLECKISEPLTEYCSSNSVSLLSSHYLYL